jgi:hypothetical protein
MLTQVIVVVSSAALDTCALHCFTVVLECWAASWRCRVRSYCCSTALLRIHTDTVLCAPVTQYSCEKSNKEAGTPQHEETVFATERIQHTSLIEHADGPYSCTGQEPAPDLMGRPL